MFGAGLRGGLGAGRVLFLAGQRLAYNGGHVSAAAIAYYGLVSLFPLVLLLLSVLGFVFPVTALVTLVWSASGAFATLSRTLDLASDPSARTRSWGSWAWRPSW